MMSSHETWLTTSRHAAARAACRRLEARCRARAASSSTTSGCARGAPPRRARESANRTIARPCRPWTDRARQPRDGAQAPHHRRRSTASLRPRRRRPGRRRACSARAPASRGARTACAGCGSQRVGPSTVHELVGIEQAEVGDARLRRRPPGAVGAEPARARAEHARRPAGHARERLRQRRACSPRPTSAPAEQQLEAGRARLGLGERQVLLVLVDRRVVADQRVDRAVGERRRGSRRGRAAGAAAAPAASRRRSSRCRRRSGAAGGCSTSQVTGRPSALARRTSSTPAALLRRHRWTRAPVSRTSSKIVASAIVSASTGTPDRPRRVASGPLAATPLPSQASFGRSQTV